MDLVAELDGGAGALAVARQPALWSVYGRREAGVTGGLALPGGRRAWDGEAALSFHGRLNATRGMSPGVAIGSPKRGRGATGGTDATSRRQ